jgi:hypothetical protein
MKLKDAYLCVNCEEVTAAREVCQSCTSRHLVSLARFVPPLPQDGYSQVIPTTTPRAVLTISAKPGEDWHYRPATPDDPEMSSAIYQDWDR